MLVFLALFISSFIVISYWRLIHSYLTAWKLDSVKATTPTDLPVTLIIAAKNEENHLPSLIAALKDQSYPHFEVIIVDDHSTDQTSSILEQSTWERLTELKAVKKGKKNALAQAIKHVKTDWILFTDADTLPHKNWIQTMVAGAGTENKWMWTGPVSGSSVPNGETLISSYFKNDLFAWLTITGGAVQGDLHPMANGANMLVHRSALREDDPFDLEKSPSGDDLFLADQLFSQGKLGFVKNQEAVVHTFPPSHWPELIDQRLRWASKNRFIQNAFFNKSIRTVATMNAWLLILFLGAWINFNIFLVFLGVVLMKAFLDQRLINCSSSWLGTNTSFWTILLQQGIAVPLTAGIGLLLFFKKTFNWKGEHYPIQ